MSAALYDAMFTRSTTLRFAAAETPQPVLAAFAELREVIKAINDDQDVDTLTEVLWAALHGLITLTRGGRLREGYDSDRVEILIAGFCGRLSGL
jgi:hypothetical protein